MNRTQAALIAALTALLGFAGGYFFYAHTMARYDTVSSVCVAMQEAVRLQMLAPEQVRDVLLACDREQAGPTLPACGLFMNRLWYDDTPELDRFRLSE